MNARKLCRTIPWLPVSAICFYLAAIALWQVGALPESEQIVQMIEKFYQRYGLTAMFLSALLEGLMYVGLYFTGSFLIVLGVIFSDGSFVSLLGISVVVAIALMIVSAVNYWIGRCSGTTDQSESQKGLFLALLHPNALAFYWVQPWHPKRACQRSSLHPYIHRTIRPWPRVSHESLPIHCTPFL